jgi:transposase-like protein
MVAPQTREGWLSEQRKDRQFTPEQKAEIVLAGLRGDRRVREGCREDQIAETLEDQWRERLLDGGKQALANPREKTAEQAELDRLMRRVGRLERALGRKTYEPGGGGGTLAGLGVRCASPGPAPWSLAATGRRWWRALPGSLVRR